MLWKNIFPRTVTRLSIFLPEYVSSSKIWRRLYFINSCNSAAQESVTSTQDNTSGRSEMSKAMQLYLQRAKSHEDFMKRERQSYELGKRHLANMMGEDPEFFTQKDVDRAIRYLFPSGLYEPRARPMMKPPEVIYPPSKAAQFDESGRPYHFLFYTRRPNFYQHLHEIVGEIQNLYSLEDKMVAAGMSLTPKPGEEMNFSTHEWLTHAEFEEKILEKLHPKHYENMITALERILTHPLSYKAKEFLSTYRKKKVAKSVTEVIEKLKYDDQGRPYQKGEGRRKSSNAEVIVWGEGKGKVTINGKDICYFKDLQSREQVMFPLNFTGLLDKVDVDATVSGGGSMGQSGSIRLAISRCLMSFVSEEVVEDMRQAGLLTQDRRANERKKPGKLGPRKMPTWKKR